MILVSLFSIKVTLEEELRLDKQYPSGLHSSALASF